MNLPKGVKIKRIKLTKEQFEKLFGLRYTYGFKVIPPADLKIEGIPVVLR